MPEFGVLSLEHVEDVHGKQNEREVGEAIPVEGDSFSLAHLRLALFP